MSTAVVLNDIVALRAWCTMGNQASVNTFNYLVTAVTGGGITDQDYVNQFDTLVASPFYQFLMPPGATYNGCQLYFVKRSGFLPAPVSSFTGAHVGVTGTEALPRVVAGILRYNTVVRGPIGRGRLFLPFISADYSGPGGEPTVAYDTLVNSVASALLSPQVVTSGPNSASFTWSLLHRVTGPPVTFTTLPIINALSADKFGGLHKRGDYGRANASPI